MSFFNHDIYFHEDDFCQAEILPIGSWKHCLEQIKEIDEFSHSHQAPGRIGWTEMYIRKDSPDELKMLGMTVEYFKEIFGKI